MKKSNLKVIKLDKNKKTPIRIDNIIGLRIIFLINVINWTFLFVASSKKKAIKDSKITPSINIMLAT